MAGLMRLNLGCGEHPISGFVNVDKAGTPDIVFDLETFPWPWEDNSVETVWTIHVMEHLGADINVFQQIIKELYRVCAHDAEVFIVVPHPRHDNFLSDPTHVRPITLQTLALFSKEYNRQCLERNLASSPLALSWDIDFAIKEYCMIPDQVWKDKLDNGQCTQEDFAEAAIRYNNVIKEMRILLKVIKE
jgi:SAM-dependent methyltransferase